MLRVQPEADASLRRKLVVFDSRRGDCAAQTGRRLSLISSSSRVRLPRPQPLCVLEIGAPHKRNRERSIRSTATEE